MTTTNDLHTFTRDDLLETFSDDDGNLGLATADDAWSIAVYDGDVEVMETATGMIIATVGTIDAAIRAINVTLYLRGTTRTASDRPTRLTKGEREVLAELARFRLTTIPVADVNTSHARHFKGLIRKGHLRLTSMDNIKVVGA